MAGIALNPSGCCCGGSATCSGCPSCPGVDACGNLILSWTNALIGGGSVILTNVAGGCTWANGCTPPLSFVVDMTGATPTLRTRGYAAGQCPDGTPLYDCTLAPSSVSCSPLLFAFTVTSAACPGLWSAGYRTLTVTP